MARRKSLFYKSVGQRTIDKVRSDISDYFYGWLTRLWSIFWFWIGAFFLTKIAAFVFPNFHENTGDMFNITFIDYVLLTASLFEPIVKYIWKFVVFLISGS